MKRDIVSARIDGMLCRAEEKGREKGMKAAMEKGMKAGRYASKIEIAHNMLVKGFSIEDIIDVTGLSECSNDE